MSTTTQRGEKQSLSQVNKCKRSYLDSFSASPFSHALLGTKQQIDQPFHILKAAENIEKLQSNGVSFVLSIKQVNLSCITREAYRKTQISHIHIKKDDSFEEDLLSIFEPVCHMIEGILTKGKAVLVHCALGKSRSATLVIAYGVPMAQLPYPNDKLQTANMD